MTVEYKITYTEVNRDQRSKYFGQLVTRSRKFSNFLEAYKYGSQLANTNPQMVGKPTIILADEQVA